VKPVSGQPRYDASGEQVGVWPHGCSFTPENRQGTHVLPGPDSRTCMCTWKIWRDGKWEDNPKAKYARGD
jgi:hypothetical protein